MVADELDEPGVVALLGAPYARPVGGDAPLGTIGHITPETRRTGEIREEIVVGCVPEIVIEPEASDVLVPPVREPVATLPQRTEAPVVTTAPELGCTA